MTATNSYYELTQDQTVNNQKTYYTYSNGSYTEVENPKDADIGSYYELKTGYNVDIKRYNGTDWQRLYPRTDWSNIENKPTNFTPSSHNHDGSYVKYGGNHSELETDSPAANAKAWVTSANLPNGNALVYNSKGKEYSLLYAFNPSNLLYGTILKWGYDDKYIRLLRYRQTNNGWQSNDWEKISAGYADTSGSVVLTEQTSIWNDQNIVGSSQGSSIGFSTVGKIGFRAIVTSGEEENAFTFRVNSNTRLYLGDTKFYPTTTNQYSIGSSDKQFNNIYGKTIYENGTSLAEKYTPGSGTLTIQAEGTAIDSFSANETSDKIINITASALGLTSALKYIGETTSDIADGSTTQTVVIDSNNVTAASGNVVTKGGKEFLWKGSAWEELGDESSHALKSITITGTGALGGGGSLEQNRTITHNAGNAANLAQKLYKISTDAYSHVNAATEVTAADIPNLSSYYLPLSGGDLTGVVSITKNISDLITIKDTLSTGGAYVKYYNNNQTSKWWRAGMHSGNYFAFLYNDVVKAKIDSNGNFYTGDTKVSYEGHTHSYLPLSGGTLTGAITLTEQSSIWNNNNIKGNGQGSTIGFNTSGQIGFAANLNNQALDAFTFRINGTNYIRISKYDLRPETTATYDLGTTVKNFNNIYGTTIYEGNTSLANKYLQINDVYEWAKASTKPSYNFSEINNRYDTLLTYSGDAPAKTGSVSPIGMTLSDELSANRLAFISASALTFEYSTNGTSWPSLSVSDATKRMLFTQHGVNIPVGRNSNDSEYTIDSSTRITITATSSSGTQYFYCSPKKLLINVSTSAAMQVLVEVRTGANYQNNGSWARYGVYQLSGWSGWNEIPFVVDTLGGDASQTSNYWQLRLTFTMTTKNDSYPKVASVNAIRLYADNCWREPSNLAYNGHMYSYDVSQNVTFPAQVKATDMLPTTTDSYNCGNSSYQWNKIYGKTIYENGTSLASKYLQLSGGDLAGSAQYLLSLKRTESGGAYIKYLNNNQTTNNWRVGMYDTGEFGFIYNNSAKAKIDTNGNLYISSGTLTGNLSFENGAKYINLRTGHNDYDGGMYYSTPGNEALVFAVKNSVTSFIFKGGLSCTSTGTSWADIIPDLQIKNGKVAINKLIPSNSQGSYNLDVNGTANATTMYENNVALTNKYQQGYTGFDLSDADKIGYVETYNGRSFEKTGNTDWNASAYSSYGYKNCRLVFKPDYNNKYAMVGLNSDPTTGTAYENLDYAWYTAGDGNCYIIENGQEQGNFGSYNAGDEFAIEYSNSYVRYYRNGELKKTTLRLLGDLLYFDAKLYSYGAKIYGVSFEPMLMGYISTTGGTITGRPIIYNPSSDTVLNLKSGSSNGCFMEFQTSSGNTAGYIGMSNTHLPLVEATTSGGGLKVLMTNSDFSVSGTTLTINIPSNP